MFSFNQRRLIINEKKKVHNTIQIQIQKIIIIHFSTKFNAHKKLRKNTSQKQRNNNYKKFSVADLVRNDVF